MADFYFDCPYCNEHTAYPKEGYIDDNEIITSWVCEGTCGAEWTAYEDDKPELEKVLYRSPRYSD